MAELVKVDQGLLDGAVVIENDVGDVLDRAVGGDGDHWDGHGDVVGRSVQEQEAVDGALHEHARILLDEFALPVVAGGEVEVVGAGQLLRPRRS